jgi:hypothetical protein
MSWQASFQGRASLPLGMALVAVVAGCGSVQNVPIRDRESAAGSVRATFHGTSGTRPSGPGVEVGYEHYTAKDTQVLGVGESVLLDGGSFFGPDTLRHKAKMQYGYIAYNHRFRFGDHFELEPFIGAARVQLKLRTTPNSGVTTTTLNDSDTGFIGGVTPRWRFNDRVAVEARLSYLHTSAWASGSTYEAALVLSPLPQVALRLGYSDRRHDIEPLVPGAASEVNIRARGPMATLQFGF